jgi:hypothetical protein
VRNRGRTLLERNRALVNDFLANYPELDCEPIRFGTKVFRSLRRVRQKNL